VRRLVEGDGEQDDGKLNCEFDDLMGQAAGL
jgi:hypothetical protein